MRIAGSPRGQAVEVVYHMAGGNAHCSYDVVTYDATLGMSACPARLPHAAVMTPTSQIKLQQEGISTQKGYINQIQKRTKALSAIPNRILEKSSDKEPILM